MNEAYTNLSEYSDSKKLPEIRTKNWRTKQNNELKPK